MTAARFSGPLYPLSWVSSGLLATLTMLSIPLASGTHRSTLNSRCQHHLEILSGAKPGTIQGHLQTIGDRSTALFGKQNDHNLTIDYLLETTKELGYQPITDAFTDHVYSRKKWTERKLTNILIKIPGTLPDSQRKIMIAGAHFDTVNSDFASWNHRADPTDQYLSAPGADDNGTGVAALLRMLEDWRGRSFSHDVWFVFFDSEEMVGKERGRSGSRRFLQYFEETEKDLNRIGGVVILDMIGIAPDPRIAHHYVLRPKTFNLSYQGFNRDKLQATLSRDQNRPFLQNPNDRDFIDASDNLPFNEKQIPTALLTDAVTYQDIPPTYHSSRDTIDRIDWEYYFEVAEMGQDLIETLADSQLEDWISDQ